MSAEPTTADILEVLLDFRDAVGLRFDKIDRRFEAMDLRFDAMDALRRNGRTLRTPR